MSDTEHNPFADPSIASAAAGAADSGSHGPEWTWKEMPPGDMDGDLEAGDENPLLGGEEGGDGAGGGAAAPAAPKPSMCGCLTITYYRPFFDVDTADVLSRLRKGVVPVAGPNSLLAEVDAKPDLYGPFWVCTTLIFVLGAAANFSSFVEYAGDDWVYDFTMVTYALALVYGYAALGPFLLWMGMKYSGVPLSLITLLCLYGYSMTPFIPAAMLCIVPLEVVDWLSLLAGFSMSAGVLLMNVYALIEQHSSQKHARVSAGFIVLGHCVLAVMLKLYFFLGSS